MCLGVLIILANLNYVYAENIIGLIKVSDNFALWGKKIGKKIFKHAGSENPFVIVASANVFLNFMNQCVINRNNAIILATYIKTHGKTEFAKKMWTNMYKLTPQGYIDNDGKQIIGILNYSADEVGNSELLEVFKEAKEYVEACSFHSKKIRRLIGEQLFSKNKEESGLIPYYEINIENGHLK